MWTTARVVVGLGVGAAAGLGFVKIGLRAEAEESELPLEQQLIRQCPYVTWDWNWDKRAIFKKTKPGDPPVVDEKKCSQHSRHIICVTSGASFKHQEVPGLKGLTREGNAQVSNLAQTLYVRNLPIRHIYYPPTHSDTVTAETISNGASHNTDFEPPRLITEELLANGMVVSPIPLTSTGYPNKARCFLDHSRLEAAFRKFFHRLDPSAKDDVIDIVVAPPDVIKYFICRALQFPPEAFSRFILCWASITWFIISGNGVVTAFAIGDTGYQPPSLLNST